MPRQCPYCNQELDDDSPPESLDSDGALLWQHPGMECPELGEMTFTFLKGSTT
jgi:hypothetical protein